MTPSLPRSVANLSSRLKCIDPTLAKKIVDFVPYWWDEELNSSPGAVQQLLLSLSNFVNLDAKSVLNDSSEIRLRNIECRYKHAANKNPDDLKAASAVIHSLATTVANITFTEYRPLPEAEIIRDEILRSGERWVDLINLTQYCWKHGIPILYIPELPVKKKMDAVVTNVNGRPIIAITKKYKHSSELLFLLAHEMGHIAHNHLDSGYAIAESEVKNIGEDPQEIEAKEFSLTLLTGKNDTEFTVKNGRQIKAGNLASQAIMLGERDHIDPGHIVLNFGFNNHMPTGKSALNKLNLNPGWRRKLKEMLDSNINVDGANQDQIDYLFKLMQAE